MWKDAKNNYGKVHSQIAKMEKESSSPWKRAERHPSSAAKVGPFTW
jgi:hypothetical protein